jgi:hypothetical protein
MQALRQHSILYDALGSGLFPEFFLWLTSHSHSCRTADDRHNKLVARDYRC